MIELYLEDGDPVGRDVERELSDLVLQHRVHVVDSAASAAFLPAGTELPAIREKDAVVAGSDAVRRWLGETRRFVADWNRFQSDVCYYNEDGEYC